VYVCFLGRDESIHIGHICIRTILVLGGRWRKRMTYISQSGGEKRTWTRNKSIDGKQAVVGKVTVIKLLRYVTNYFLK
jgi:hypothetical protein